FCKLVSNEDIAKENYDLSVNTYVEKEDTREKIDIKKLNKEIEATVKKQEVLRKQIDEIIKGLEENIGDSTENE
ncbi:MAG: type I restriction-modification system subunit M, partial [Firmicutes bacterium]|nr:type I restriction-modification system subunit M [Bacillota bacterium]